jgi:putative FmdB family regulatory protein
MTLYDYDCKKCGIVEIEKKPDEEVKKCPKCGGEIKRRYTAAPIHFNCKGFYKTDNKQ